MNLLLATFSDITDNSITKNNESNIYEFYLNILMKNNKNEEELYEIKTFLDPNEVSERQKVLDIIDKKRKTEETFYVKADIKQSKDQKLYLKVLDLIDTTDNLEINDYGNIKGFLNKTPKKVNDNLLISLKIENGKNNDGSYRYVYREYLLNYRLFENGNYLNKIDDLSNDLDKYVETNDLLEFKLKLVSINETICMSPISYNVEKKQQSNHDVKLEKKEQSSNDLEGKVQELEHKLQEKDEIINNLKKQDQSSITLDKIAELILSQNSNIEIGNDSLSDLISAITKVYPVLKHLQNEYDKKVEINNSKNKFEEMIDELSKQDISQNLLSNSLISKVREDDIKPYESIIEHSLNINNVSNNFEKKADVIKNQDNKKSKITLEERDM